MSSGFEDPSDGESFQYAEQGGDSENDAPFIAEAEAEHLKEQNRSLTRENSQLQAQFAEAMKISAQMDAIHEKNRRLVAQSNSLKSKNDDLQRQLEISLRSNSELTSRLDEEKKTSQTHRDEDRNAGLREMEAAQRKAKAEIESVYAQMQELQVTNDQTNTERRLMSNKLDRLMSNACRHFKVQFRGLDELVDYLGKSDTAASDRDVRTPAPVLEPKATNDASAVSHKLRRERAKTKEVTAKAADFEHQLKKSTREKHDLEISFKQQLDALRTKHQRETEDRELAEADRAHAMRALEAKVEALKGELSKAKKEAKAVLTQAQPMQTQQEAARPREVPITTRSSNEPTRITRARTEPQSCVNSVQVAEGIDIATEQLLEMNGELERRLEMVSAKSDEYYECIAQYEAYNSELQAIVGKQKTELEVAERVYQEVATERETFRNALHVKESARDTKEKTGYRREIASYKVQVHNLQRTVDSHKSHMHELAVTNEESQHKIEQLKNKARRLKDTVLSNEREIQQLKTNIGALDDEMRSKPVLTQDDLLPPSVWAYADFGGELNTAISKIANGSLQAASKLRTIYKTIHDHFVRLIASRDAALDTAYSENQSIRAAVQEFLVAVSIAVDAEPVTFDIFFSTNAGEVLSKKIADVRLARDNFKRKDDEQSAVIGYFGEKMGLSVDGDVGAMVSKIDGLGQKVQGQSDVIRKRTQKCKALSRNLAELERRAQEDATDADVRIKTLIARVEELTQQLEATTNANKTMKRDLHTAKLEIREIKSSNEDSTTASSARYEQDMAEAKREKELLEAELTHQVEETQMRLEDTENALEEANSAITRLTKTLQAQKSSIQEKSEAISAMSQDFGERERALVERSESEKRQLVDSYEKAVGEIRWQCDAHRNDVEKLARDLAESEKRVRRGKSAIVELKRAALKSDKDMKAQSEQIEREKALSAASARSIALNAKTECTERLNEQKTKSEKEKRNMYAFVTDSFKQFYNAQDALDERTFRSVVGHVKDELARLALCDSAVRRLVGASQHQRTDDAVAQALMGD